MLEREITLEITEKEAPFAPDDELGTYVIRRWSWRQKQKAVLDATRVLDEKTGLGMLEVLDYEVYQMLTCVKQAPENLELSFRRFSGREAIEATEDEEAVEAIEGLDADVGSLIIGACRKVNGLKEADIRDFLQRSEQEGKAGIPG